MKPWRIHQGTHPRRARRADDPLASMKPWRIHQGTLRCHDGGRDRLHGGFNEALANSPGNPTRRRASGRAARAASMKPWRIHQGTPPIKISSERQEASFNEALANSPGNPRRVPLTAARALGFNEALANSPGNPSLVGEQQVSRAVASMKPWRIHQGTPVAFES